MASTLNEAPKSGEGLANEIRALEGTDKTVETTLATDERVIARVTDGIYRKPGSALRELISNAYDADATRVVIKTDAPRFERIIVEDNGHGMSPEALAHLIRHIGGSAKRNDEGLSLGITAKGNPRKSPNGRELIGKIGIGLFSISQLTSTFEILTKVKGDNHRTVASVVMRQYSDEIKPGETNAKFEAGKVTIWREKAADTDTHGTTVILTGVRSQARDILRDRRIWSAIEENERAINSSENASTELPLDPPTFHIGRVNQTGELLEKFEGKFQSLPWKPDDAPEVAFKKFSDSVWADAVGTNPKLERIFDFYLSMIWDVSLAVPLAYVDGHLFDKKISDFPMVYELSNKPKGNATKVSSAPEESIREKFSLGEIANEKDDFEVYFDDLKLSHPIKYQDLPVTSHAIKFPLIFIGKCEETFSKTPFEISGGPLSFQAYLFWTPKVAPVEHQGALIRIHGSSGTLFDPTFMRYQVAELNRLRQITCEIYVSEGLDSALNIDRESFNNAHPHYIFLAKWLHGALRQVANVQKRVASELREQSRGDFKDVALSEIQSIAFDAWNRESSNDGSRPPEVVIAEKLDGPTEPDTYTFSRDSISILPATGRTSKERLRQTITEEKLKGIIQVLASFDLLDGLTARKRDRLIKAISKILQAGEL